jgi:hypothetical protein
MAGRGVPFRRYTRLLHVSKLDVVQHVNDFRDIRIFEQANEMALCADETAGLCYETAQQRRFVYEKYS